MIVRKGVVTWMSPFERRVAVTPCEGPAPSIASTTAMRSARLFTLAKSEAPRLRDCGLLPCRSVQWTTKESMLMASRSVTPLQVPALPPVVPAAPIGPAGMLGTPTSTEPTVPASKTEVLSADERDVLRQVAGLRRLSGDRRADGSDVDLRCHSDPFLLLSTVRAPAFVDGVDYVPEGRPAVRFGQLEKSGCTSQKGGRDPRARAHAARNIGVRENEGREARVSRGVGRALAGEAAGVKRGSGQETYRGSVRGMRQPICSDSSSSSGH